MSGDWHIPMGVVMRREVFTGSGRRPRCSVRPPTYDGRHVASGPGYGWCGSIGRWKRGEQHLCEFHAGVAATLDVIDQQVHPKRPHVLGLADPIGLGRWLADMANFAQWRTRTLHHHLPGITLDGLWRGVESEGRKTA